MKIALAQIDAKIGDVSGNQKKVLAEIEKAKKAKADLVLFPELVLVGYPPRDLLDYASLIDRNLAALDAIAKGCQGITAIVGYVDRNPAPTGKRFFNAAAVLRDGKCIARYHKRLLPYYDVFEEERYFEAGTESLIVDICGKRVGVTICEDAWNIPGFVDRLYPSDPLKDYEGKVDYLVNLSASPFHLGKSTDRIRLFQGIAKRLNAPVALCNAVGANDELIFDGGSFLLDRSGEVLSLLPVFEDACQVGDGIAAWPEEEGEWLFDALTLGVRDYLAKSGASKVILGLSGGVDSSVVACLLVKAIGATNVLGLALPTRFNSNDSLDDALTLSTRLGIECRIVPIETLYESFEKQLTETLGKRPAGLTLENIQPRIRMTILMALANEEGRLLFNTSNKSEIATGYATLYGDTAGALAVLGDLTKRQVYEVARAVNAAGEIIPKRVLTRAPTAELRENQKDEDTLPKYSVLDDLVNSHVTESSDPTSLKRTPEIDRYLSFHTQSEYKRRQLPPVLRVSKRAFGMGRRTPVISLKTGEK